MIIESIDIITKANEIVFQNKFNHVPAYEKLKFSKLMIKYMTLTGPHSQGFWIEDMTFTEVLRFEIKRTNDKATKLLLQIWLTASKYESQLN